MEFEKSVRELAARFPDIGDQGPIFPEGNKVSAATKRLGKLVAAINEDSCFIPYRESFRFAEVLHAALDRIEDEIVPAHPNEALCLFAMFIETDARVIANGDDSAGAMAEAYYRACRLFATVAENLEKPRRAHELFFRLAANSDYGTRDQLFDHAHQILSAVATKIVIEVWMERLGKEGDDKFWGLSTRLGQLAQSIGDSSLYEEIHLRGRDPKEYLLVAFNVAECHLKCGNPERALAVLPMGDIEKRFLSERNDLLAKVYEALGEEVKLRQVILEEFHHSGSATDAKRLVGMAPETEKASLRSQLDRLVLESVGSPSRQAEYFVAMGDLETAEQVVVENVGSFNGDFYESLLQIAEALQEDYPVGSSVLYRAMMESVLNRAISKYYPHAIRYYNYLKEFDSRINEWKGVQPHQIYWNEIKEKHAKKSAFWRRIL